MISVLGPRKIKFRTAAGTHGDIEITLAPLPDQVLELNSQAVTSVRGVAQIRSQLLNHDIDLQAQDEVQLIFRLLWMSDIYIQTRFAALGAIVYQHIPGDIKEPFDVYS
jgi:hypothetical protein